MLLLYLAVKHIICTSPFYTPVAIIFIDMFVNCSNLSLDLPNSFPFFFV